MKKELLTMLVLLLGCNAIYAQGTKAERMKYIRQVYAEAKQKVADNGKNSDPRLDLTIEKTETVDSEDGTRFVENTKSIYYYEKKRIYIGDGAFNEIDRCYFFTMKWKAKGCSQYTEMLFNPEDGQLLFSFNRFEYEGGTNPTEESRFYYNENGKVIELILSVGGSNSTKTNLEDIDPDESDLMTAAHHLQVFNDIVAPHTPVRGPSRAQNTPKAERMKFIRNTYVQAKQKAEQRVDAGRLGKIAITLHNQEDGDGPSQTTEIKFFSEMLTQKGSSSKHCYFITTRSRSDAISIYHEYLFDPESDDLIFSFGQFNIEDSKKEVRNYYHENGECLETKTNEPKHHDDDADGDMQDALQYINVFHEITN